jgi:hypothetical protein
MTVVSVPDLAVWRTLRPGGMWTGHGPVRQGRRGSIETSSSPDFHPP